MGDPGRRQLAGYAAAAVIVALLGARYLRQSGPGPGGGAAGKPVPVRVSGGGGAGAGGWAVVQVAGEVRRPGVYRLRAGKRVDDAVRLAGGATARAELAGVNLAAKVEDGRQVIVPARGGVVPASGGGAATAAPAPGTPLNLNTATVEQLDGLD